MRVNMVFAVWMFATGVTAILKPKFFFKAERLTPEKIKRNTRVWRACGAGLVVAGTAAFAIELIQR